MAANDPWTRVGLNLYVAGRSLVLGAANALFPSPTAVFPVVVSPGAPTGPPPPTSGPPPTGSTTTYTGPWTYTPPPPNENGETWHWTSLLPANQTPPVGAATGPGWGPGAWLGTYPYCLPWVYTPPPINGNPLGLYQWISYAGPQASQNPCVPPPGVQQGDGWGPGQWNLVPPI